MYWKDSLRQLQQAKSLSGLDIIREFLSRSHNSPRLPKHAYDGDDPMPLALRLTDTERHEFGFLPRLDHLANLHLHLAVPPIAQKQPVYMVRVHVVCAADDDGGNAFAQQETVVQWIGEGLTEANAIYAAHGAGIQFMFDAGDVNTVRSTMINQDFVVPPGTNMKTALDTPPLSDSQIGDLGATHEVARNQYCQQWPDRCVFLLCSGTSLQFDAIHQEWVVSPRSGYAYSWEDKEFVNFPSVWGALHGAEIAHESGHFFHLWHTHGATPKDAAEATQTIRAYVQQNNVDLGQGLLAFDGDLASGVQDTPPDPGPGFYASAEDASAGDPATRACDLVNSPNLVVDFGRGTSHSYVFAADRGDVMSYFKDCGTFAQHFSPDQIARMRTAIETGNRRRLAAAQLGDTATPGLYYSGLWDAGVAGCVWWPMCTETELRAKTAELWPTMRLRQMTGFVLNGQVLFSAIWQPGTFSQVWWPNCSDQDFHDKTGALWGSMRPAQVHAFVVGGEVRYACLWNAGTSPQVWWENCSEQQFRDKTGELWPTMRPVQAQGFVVQGEVRYSGLWDAGTQPTVWWPNCSEQDFRDKTGELWGTMRPSQVNAFHQAGGTRFSAIWTPSKQDQVWWPLCTQEQVRQKTGDLWSSMRPALFMPVS
jgi:hypothetical protein